MDKTNPRYVYMINHMEFEKADRPDLVKEMEGECMLIETGACHIPPIGMEVFFTLNSLYMVTHVKHVDHSFSKNIYFIYLEIDVSSSELSHSAFKSLKEHFRKDDGWEHWR